MASVGSSTKRCRRTSDGHVSKSPRSDCSAVRMDMSVPEITWQRGRGRLLIYWIIAGVTTLRMCWSWVSVQARHRSDIKSVESGVGRNQAYLVAQSNARFNALVRLIVEVQEARAWFIESVLVLQRYECVRVSDIYAARTPYQQDREQEGSDGEPVSNRWDRDAASQTCNIRSVVSADYVASADIASRYVPSRLYQQTGYKVRRTRPPGSTRCRSRRRSRQRALSSRCLAGRRIGISGCMTARYRSNPIEIRARSADTSGLCKNCKDRCTIKLSQRCRQWSSDDINILYTSHYNSNACAHYSTTGVGWGIEHRRNAKFYLHNSSDSIWCSLLLFFLRHFVSLLHDTALYTIIACDNSLWSLQSSKMVYLYSVENPKGILCASLNLYTSCV